MILTHLVFFSFLNGAGGDNPIVAPTSFEKTLSFGMGPMGKSRVHPHPLFSRHKQ